MSINVTVNGNPLSICRGRMVLSDLDQIKKNERDRRRRLRLEQVRQQSKEISNKLLERAKNIAKEELNRLEKDDRSQLKQMHDRKIMEIQQKFQEDMADIGQAHAAAALQVNEDVIIEEERQRNRMIALKRGKEAAQQVKETQEKDTDHQVHQDRLRQVRELENMRSAMIAKLPRKGVSNNTNINDTNLPEEQKDEESVQQKFVKKKKNKKLISKKSPGRVRKSHLKVLGTEQKIHSPLSKAKAKSLKRSVSKYATLCSQERCVTETDVPRVTASKAVEEAENAENTENVPESEHEDPRKTVPILSRSPTKADKIARYNPEDYTQETSDSISSDSSSSISDDSSYFSDSSEQVKSLRTPIHYTSSADSRVQMHDHSTRQKKTSDKPFCVVEKIDIRNEPNAFDAAREIQQAEVLDSHLAENRKLSAQRRGEDAMLREKVRRDYKALMQNLDQFAREERKLKASQIPSYLNDAYLQEQRRKMLKEQHKKKLDHALRTMLNENSMTQCSPPPVERVITLTPRQHEVSDSVPHAVWQEPYCVTGRTEINNDRQNKEKEDEKSHAEQILDMLRKVERQKRLLLQEYGADLPNDIFNASVKTLFEAEKSVAPPQSVVPERPLSPEIKVINMSSCDEGCKKMKKKKKETSQVQKVEIAVQTMADKTSTAEDKSVQVELLQEKQSESNSTSADIDTPVTRQYPIEPKVTVITPAADSSESVSSADAGVVIDINKEELKVTPKKKRSSVKSTKRIPSKVYQKSRSMPASKTSSPMKRFSKSLPGSQQSSPKKSSAGTIDTPSKRIDIYVNKSGFNIKVEPSQHVTTAVDATTQSCQIYSMDSPDHSANKPYRIQAQTKRIIKIRDTSDTSTSFASLPPVRPRSVLDALTNNTPILEMLDSSANESLRRLRTDVSPVSTPETPSPRTMRISSNMPHPDRISRMLQYASTDSQTNGSTLMSSTKNDQSTSTDPSDYSRAERTSRDYIPSSSKQRSISSQFCKCKNPECQLLHTKFDDIHDYALRNCPQILKKYEDLQNMCTERIASLTDLIEKVRNEQKGLEFSISAGDETSLMQLPTTKPVTDDLQSVRRLVESIEAIHNQLAKTLIESQRIIKNEVIVEEDVNRDIGTTVFTNGNVIKDATEYIESADTIQKPKAKPKIISEEKVNIQLNRFKMQHRPQPLTATSIPERNSSSPQKDPSPEDDMIEKLSKEILQQSKDLSKSGNTPTSFRGISTSMTKRRIQTATSIDHSKADTSVSIWKDDVFVREENSTRESKKTSDFVPLLAGIPKVPRTGGNSTQNNARGKPPVTLLSGPYRTEIESSGHELSTIVEFDTPDTVNKSQNIIKSPSPIKKSTETQASKSSITVKPSVHVAPLLTFRDQHLVRKPYDSSSTKMPSMAVASTHRSETDTVYDSPRTSKDTEHGNLMKSEDGNPKDPVPEKSDKSLQCNTVNQLLQTEDLQPLSSISTDFNNQGKMNKDKITSTSSNSFSGLSGISEITSTPSSDMLKYASSPEEMETVLKKLGANWAITTLKKIREVGALSSSSNSDLTPINTARRMISPTKKQLDSNAYGLPDFSDVSSISIKEASKSTEQAVLLKGRTSTPKLQNSNSDSVRTNSSSTNSSENFQEPSDSLIVPNVSLTKAKSNKRQLKSL